MQHQHRSAGDETEFVGKATLVEEKQVWRYTSDGQDAEDIIALRCEKLDVPPAPCTSA